MSARRRLAFSTIIVMGSTLGSALLGFVREVVNARLYGTHWELDTFLAASAIPTVLFGVFNGALINALVPVFSGYLASGDDERAWGLANTVFNLVFLALAACAVCGWILAPWYVPLIARGFPTPQLEVAVRMTRWLMPSVVATSLAGVVSAVLNANKRFVVAALQGTAANAVIICTVLALDRRIGIYALTLGTALGLTAQLLIQIPALLRLGRYRPHIDLHHPGLPAIWALLGPIIIGSAAGQIALCSDRFFASMLPPGSISGINYALRVVGVPLQIFAAAIATVIFPLFSGQFAGNDLPGLRRSVRTALEGMLLVMIPATVLFAVASETIVASLFEGGAFDRSAVELCARLLPFAAAGLLAQSATIILTRCCIAGGRTQWTVVASTASVVVNVGLSAALLPTMQAQGLLTANAVSQWAQTLVIVWAIHRRVATLPLTAIGGEALRVVLASGAMAGAYLWMNALVPSRNASGPAALVAGGEKILLALAVFLIAAFGLRVRALSVVADILQKKSADLRERKPHARS